MTDHQHNTDTADADTALKARAPGDVGARRLPRRRHGDHPRPRARCSSRPPASGPGDHVLDVAAGSGNVAIPAAATGAHVIASDLTPELLDQGRADAEAAGVDLEWHVGDAEHLPFDDDSFDAVTSCVGVMFAPHHQQAADELVRVCRPGGPIGADRVDARPGSSGSCSRP